MNAQTKSEIASPQSVTTGSLPASKKVYVPAFGRDDVCVPLREVELSAGAGEQPVRLYDSSGPYTDARAAIDLGAGLPEIRQAWLARRPGLVPAFPRALKPEDNGSVPADKLVPVCPARREVLTGSPHQPLTQIEFARAGLITEEMLYIAARENVGRTAKLGEAELRLADGESFGASIPAHVTPEFVRGEVARRTRDHSRQHQPPGTRADDHRPQLPREDQRQHRQFGSHFFRSTKRSRRWSGRSAGARIR